MSAIRPRILLLLLVCATTGCGPNGWDAAAVLADVAAGAEHSRLKATTPAPVVSTIHYQFGDTPRVADIYRSPEGSRRALVLVPGVTPQGKNDTRLVDFAKSLARVRFLVMVPELPSLKALKVRGADAQEIVAAFGWLRDRNPDTPAGGIGLIAISYAAGPALIATADSLIAEDVRFLITIGGYYDISQLVTFVTTGFYRRAAQHRWRHAPPNPYGKWVFLHSNADQVADPDDQARLAQIAARKLDDLAAPIADLTRGMRAEGQAVLALLTNADPERVPELMAALNPRLRAEMRSLDPSSADMSRLAATLYLIHGRADPVIPSTESARLHAQLPRGRSRLYLLDGLGHVDPDFSLSDKFTLWHATTDILAERD